MGLLWATQTPQSKINKNETNAVRRKRYLFNLRRNGLWSIHGWNIHKQNCGRSILAWWSLLQWNWEQHPSSPPALSRLQGEKLKVHKTDELQYKLQWLLQYSKWQKSRQTHVSKNVYFPIWEATLRWPQPQKSTARGLLDLFPHNMVLLEPRSYSQGMQLTAAGHGWSHPSDCDCTNCFGRWSSRF